MKILVSACLLGENCKYSGGNNYSEKAAAFVQGMRRLSRLNQQKGRAEHRPPQPERLTIKSQAPKQNFREKF